MSIASKRDNNQHDTKKPQSEYERNQKLLRKYIFTEVRHLQKHKSLKTIMKMTSQISVFVFLLSYQDFTPSMSLMTIASALPETDYMDSTGDKVNSKSSSYDYEAGTSFDDVDYSEYDFDEEEDATCNVKFDFRIFRDTMDEIPITEKKKYEIDMRFYSYMTSLIWESWSKTV